jgi:epoxyqueuosine reductase
MIAPAGAETEQRRRAARRAKQLGREAGFHLVRIAPATELHAERARYLAWIEQGRAGEMRWITPDRARRSADPSSVLPQARAVVCVGLSYWAGRRPPDAPNAGRIARYAWGRDYHEVMLGQLRSLAERLAGELGGEHRWYVDTGPLMDKALAARSGLGWYGKNTNLLTEEHGSWVLLGEIVTTLDLEPDVPLDRDCGACKLCLVACPTGALGPEYTIDSRRCISYLTIEHRGPIPRELRPAMDSWVFGCDICQDVCPPAMEPYLRTDEERRDWTQEVRRYLGRASASEVIGGESTSSDTSPIDSHPLFPSGIRPSVDLLWLLRLTHEQYLEAFRGTAIRRAKVWMLRRNAAVALGNTGDETTLGPLLEAMRTDSHPMVRSHAAWAIARLGSRLRLPQVPELLRSALQTEEDEEVKEELELALREASCNI